MNATDARLWHPGLRINRVLRVMLHTRWSAEGVGRGPRRVQEGARTEESRSGERGGSTDGPEPRWENMDIQPQDPRLLTNRDVNRDPFSCCGNEELVFLKCPRCGYLMVFCCECDTLYPDLHDLTQRLGLGLTNPTDRVVCPSCVQPFDDYYFLRQPHVDKYLPLLEELVAAGLVHLLSPARRSEL